MTGSMCGSEEIIRNFSSKRECHGSYSLAHFISTRHLYTLVNATIFHSEDGLYFKFNIIMSVELEDHLQQSMIQLPQTTMILLLFDLTDRHA